LNGILPTFPCSQLGSGGNRQSHYISIERKKEKRRNGVTENRRNADTEKRRKGLSPKLHHREWRTKGKRRWERRRVGLGTVMKNVSKLDPV